MFHRLDPLLSATRAASSRRAAIASCGPRIRREDRKDAAAANRNGPAKGKGGSMSRKFIAVEESFREWRKDPEYVAEYDALEDEAAMASALIKARGEAAMTQEQ